MSNPGIVSERSFERSKTLARHCLNCSKIFWVVPSQLKRGFGNFCSTRCSTATWNTGSKTADHKKKISLTLKKSGKWSGETNPKYSGGPQVRTCVRCGVEFSVSKKSNKAKHCSKVCAAKDRAKFGEEHPGWKGGIGKHVLKRCHTKYKEWRKAVFERDGYACAVCSQAKPRINAHHILSFAGHPDRRYDVENGVTLCTLHHQMLHPKIVLTDTRKYFLNVNCEEI